MKAFKKNRCHGITDGAKIKREQHCAQFLARFPGQAHFIGFNEWPPMSPDLNPLGYSVWAVLEAKACQKPHKTIDSLKKALQKAWDELDLPGACHGRRLS